MLWKFSCCKMNFWKLRTPPLCHVFPDRVLSHYQRGKAGSHEVDSMEMETGRDKACNKSREENKGHGFQGILDL